MHRRVEPKGLAPMERRVPKSEKYSHIQSTLNTGLTVNKVRNVTAREYAKRRNEIFFRITKGQLVELFNEYEFDDDEAINNNNSGGGGYGSQPHIVSHNANEQPTYTKPYLILDVREYAAFDSCHVLQAKSFPFTQLRRDMLHPDIYKFKNKPESLIIIYCNDERDSKDAAKTLVDRGIDNIYLLTGGLNEFTVDYGEYIEGVPLELPQSRQSQHSRGSRAGTGAGTGAGGSHSQNRNSSGLGRIGEDEDGYSPSRGPYSNYSDPHKLTPRKLASHNSAYNQSDNSSMGSAGSPDRPARSTRGGASASGASAAGRRNSSRDDYSETGSMNSTHSVAESIISRATSRKGRF